MTNRIIIPPAHAREIVEQARQVYLRNCSCRVQERRCPPETWAVCLLFENASPDEIQDARLISKEQALDVLETTARRHAIYNLFYKLSGEITELCSCCTCCCHPLLGLKEDGSYAEQLRSAYIAVTDASRCNGCGLCDSSCFFEARDVEEGISQVNAERCFGCGRCLEFCPEQAITLELKAGRGIPLPR